MANFHDNYSFIDKLLHYLAFNTQKLQISLAKNESEQHKKSLSKIAINKPVFITSLPRSGTTILLNTLCKTEQFCYQSYQDMPFLFTPIQWGEFSRKFSKQDEYTERAHNDGIKINQQSPEAFEEVFYKAFWPERFQGSRLELWSENGSNEFSVFFSDYIKKLIYREQQRKHQSNIRYLSKNNFNIKRLGLINNMFPDAICVVPFRQPIQHAMSLLQQHLNFTKLHKENKFSKDYMEAIGHYDFGMNLKPINFNGWVDLCQHEPETLDFWLEYWVNTYQYIHDSDHENVMLICFEGLTKNPESSLSILSDKLSLNSESLMQWKNDIKEVKQHPIDNIIFNQKLLRQAQDLYESLVVKSINAT